MLFTLNVMVNEIKDLYGKSDKNSETYCIVNVSNQWDQTIGVTGSKPIFDANFDFDLSEDFPVLTLFVFTSKNGRKYNATRKLFVPLLSLPEGNKVANWFPLDYMYPKTYASGEINILAKWEAETLIVIVKSGRNISFPKTNFKCYTVVEVDNQEHVKKKTKVATVKQEKVRWSERLLFSKKNGIGPLMVTVWKESKREGASVLLGTVNIHPSKFESSPLDEWFNLAPSWDNLRIQDENFNLEKLPADQSFGTAKITTEWKKLLVFPIHYYEFLEECLNFNLSEMVSILRYTTVKRDRAVVAKSLMNICDYNSSTLQLLKSLLSEEIEATGKAETLFRLDSLTTKTIDVFMKRVGFVYLKFVLGTALDKMLAFTSSCEIDPTKIPKKEDIKQNYKDLIAFTTMVLERIYSSISECPMPIRLCLWELKDRVSKKFPGKELARDICVVGVFFLRFMGPALMVPKSLKLIDVHPDPTVKALMNNVAKVVQRIANPNSSAVVKGTQVDQPEYYYMVEMDKFVESERGNMKKFIDTLSTPEKKDTFYEPKVKPDSIQKDLAEIEAHLEATYNDIKEIVKPPSKPDWLSITPGEKDPDINIVTTPRGKGRNEPEATPPKSTTPPPKTPDIRF
uniref:Uncharacterized protein n=1 Tax=Arcella intermedia TaxID=1963864 RepID=A0A6B2KZQ0_9EUKA